MRATEMHLRAAVMAISLCSPVAWSGGISDWINKTLIDPEDGMLDASDYLASAAGFLPVPIIITEPAVGFGLGMAAVYFHPPKEELDSEQHPHAGPPSLSIAFGALTENETHVYGGAHLGMWKDDHIRYTGALAEMNVNMTFYVDDRDDDLGLDNGIDFNIDGALLYQEAMFRLRESNWWLGANFTYVTAENTFKLGEILPPEIPDPGFDFDLGSLGLVIEYDSTDSIFTPSSGLSAEFGYTNYDKNWGSDFEYDEYEGSLQHYTAIGEYSSLGLRLEAATVSGEVPFFAYPSVDLRGIPAMRYQGKTAVVAEVEYMWGITPRWTAVFFGGVGQTETIDKFLGDGQTVAAGGLGFRYRLARKFGLQAGVDIARGPEDTSIYLTIGSAW